MKCDTDIRKDIISTAGKMLVEKGAVVEDNTGFFPNPRISTRAINQINRLFKSLVVKEGEKGSFFIDPSKRLVDLYLDDYNKKTKKEEKNDTGSVDSSSLLGLDINNEDRLEFHINTLNVINKFLENIGIEQRLVPEFLSENGTIIEGAIAAANFMQGTVDIIDDLEKRPSAWDKLPEEAAHWWYRLLDKNSELKKALLTSALTDRKEEELRNSLYGETYNGPKVIGKLDIDSRGNVTSLPALTPIREEAIGQLIAEAIKRIETKNASAEDYSFFKMFLEWINSIIDIFRETKEDPFEVAAMKILSSDMSDLMTWEEYRKVNNIVNFADVLTEQSVAPIDYTLLEDLIEYQIDSVEYGNNVIPIYTLIIKGDTRIHQSGIAESIEFNTKEEMDSYIYKVFGKEHDKRQKQKIIEERDNQIFYDRLLNKTFKRKSKYLPKTLKKYYSLFDTTLSVSFRFRNWEPLSESQKRQVKKLEKRDKELLIRENDYENIVPTLKVLPDILKKYSNKKGNNIILSEPIKIDSANKQELSVLNNVKDLIRAENPSLKSITAEEFVAEVHHWLQVNYLLGFANEKNYLSYRIDQTFVNVPDRVTYEDIEDMTEEELLQLTPEQRNNLARILGLNKKNPKVYHNKVSLRFNDTYHITPHSHFPLSPSAWGNLTYFYTGKNKFKDAVLLHEIQNDNIERLRKILEEQGDAGPSLELELEAYKESLHDGLLNEIRIIQDGGYEVMLHDMDTVGILSRDHVPLRTIINQVKGLPYNTGYAIFLGKIQEKIDLYEANNNVDNKLEKAQEVLDKAYSTRRVFQSILRRGGIKSLLDEVEKEEIQKIIEQVNNLEERTWDGAVEETNITTKKAEFTRRIKQIEDNINYRIAQIYEGNLPRITLTAPALPLPKALRENRVRHLGGRTQRIGNSQPVLNDNLDFLFIYSEKKMMENLSIKIEEAKRSWVTARNRTNHYNFNLKLKKLSLEQFTALIENQRYNDNLLSELIDKQSQKDLLEANKNTVQYKGLLPQFYEIVNMTKDDFISLREIDDIKIELFDSNLPTFSHNVYQDAEFYYRLMHVRVTPRGDDRGETVATLAKIKKTELDNAVIESGKKENIIKYYQDKVNNLIDEATKKYNELQKVKHTDLLNTLSIEMNYFTPLVHHLIQKHIKTYGKEIPMYMAGFNITKLTQGTGPDQILSAALYAGKEEINPLTKEEITELKFRIGARMIGLLSNKIESITDPLEKLEIIKRAEKDPQIKKAIVGEIIELNGKKPYQTGVVYNLMSQIKGVKLIWQDKIEGIKGDTGGYLVDLTDYNYNTPVLFGLQNAKRASKPKNKSSEEVNTFMKKLLKKMGVDIKLVDDIANSANGSADFVKSLILLTRESGEVSLPEETMHFVVRWIKLKNPTLYNALLNKVSKTALYDKIYDDYKSTYVDGKGRPDIGRIREEAITKHLTEVITNKLENPDYVEDKNFINQVVEWWKNVIQWIKSVFQSIEVDPFSELAESIVNDTFSASATEIAKSTLSTEDIMFQLNEDKDLSTQEALFNAITEISSKISKIPKINKETGEIEKDEQGNPKDIYKYEDIELPKRITDRVKSVRGKTKFNEATPEEKEIFEVKRKFGDNAHLWINDIINRFVDKKTGLLLPESERTTSISIAFENRVESGIYEMLEKYVKDLLESFPEGTRFKSEVMGANLQKKEGGTLDFLYFLPDDKGGKIGVFDWKFIGLNINKFDDIPWYDFRDWNIQMEGYRELLRSYGIPDSKFDKTRMIPFIPLYNYDKDTKKLSPKGLLIGDKDPKKIGQNYLLPVPTRTETTGNKRLDGLLKKLFALYDLKMQESVSVEQKTVKASELNELFKVIRLLQTKGEVEGIIEQGLGLLKRLEEKLEYFNTKFSGKVDEVDLTEYNELSGEILDIIDSIKVYQDIDIELKGLVKDNDELSEKLKKLNSEARGANLEAKDVLASLINNIGSLFGIERVADPEKEIRNAYSEYMRSLSQSKTRSGRFFYRLISPILNKIDLETVQRIEKLSDIRARVFKWADTNSIDRKKILSYIKRKDSHRLISVYSPDFYKQFEEAALAGDLDWFKKNIKMEEYNEWFTKERDKAFARLEGARFFEDAEKNAKKIEEEKQKYLRLYDPSSKAAYGNWKMRQLANDEWFSEEYKNIKKVPELLELYNHIVDTNKQAMELGIFDEFSRKTYKTFLPFVQKNILDKLVFGGKIRLGEEILRQITIDEKIDKLGDRDPFTGELRNKIPFYFTRELDNQDDVSEDIFEILALFENQIVNYKYKSEVENISKALLFIEKSKGHLATDKSGNIDESVSEPLEGNERNAEFLEDFVKNLVWGQRYTDIDATDQKIGRIGSGLARKINEKFGRKIFSDQFIESLENEVSITKLISALNKWFQIKTLAGSLPIAISNYIGGKMQSYLTSGKYQTQQDLRKAEMEVASLVSNSERSKKYLGLVKYFDAFLSKELSEKVRGLSLSKITENDVVDLIMILQRMGDRGVELPLILTFFDNAVIVDGKILNVREYVKAKNNWNDRLSLSIEDQKKLAQQIEDEILQLKNSDQSLLNNVTLDDKGRVNINGIVRVSDAVGNYREKIQQMIRDVIGSTGVNDPKRANMSILMDSFMMFKNWIPRLADTRVGELRRRESSQSWDYGRARIFFKILLSDFRRSGSNIYNIIKGTAKGQKIVNELYEKKAEEYYKKTGEKMSMTAGEFDELVVNAVQKELQELLLVLGLMGLFLGVAATGDEEEDPEVKGFWTWAARTVDRVRDEIAFFYDPRSLVQILNGSIFPSLGVLTDGFNIISAISKEGFGYIIQPLGFEKQGEEIVENNKVIKYIFKGLPITKEILSYLVMYDKDLANELGIRLTKESRINR